MVKEPSGDVDGVRKRLEAVAAVQTICSSSLRDGTREPAAAWREIRDALDLAEWVAPVVIDEAGRSSYPTGTVTVRSRRTRPKRT